MVAVEILVIPMFTLLAGMNAWILRVVMVTREEVRKINGHVQVLEQWTKDHEKLDEHRFHDLARRVQNGEDLRNHK